MNVAAHFVQCLEAHGVEYIFGVPGEENLDMLEALRTSPIKLIVTRHEQSAVFMAATYGRLTGKAGVAFSTLWPGATNLMTWVAYAQLGGMPVIVITGQKPIKKSKQGRFQVIDVVGMMRPVTKYSTSIVDSSRVASTLAHAFLTAESERPGAVHIELPEDIAGETALHLQPIVYEKVRRPIIDEKSLHSLINKLEASHRPMILIWAWANRKRITKYLTKFIEKYNIPFFCSQMGKWVVDEWLSQYIGTAAMSAGDYVHEAIDQADLILSVWHDSIEKPTNIIEIGKTDVVHINYTPADYDQLYRPSLQIVGDIGNVFWQLDQATIDSSWWRFDSVYDVAKKWQVLISAHIDTQQNAAIMMPARLIKETRELLHHDDIVALDNGLYKLWFARNYETYLPNTLLLDNALASMGAWYCSGLIAKMLNPEHRVVVFVGDGGLVMNLWDMETAVRLWLDMVIVVLRDDAYGMIKRKQRHMRLADFGLDFNNPDFDLLAKSFGATSYSVTRPDDYRGILTQALANKWISLIDCPFAYPDVIE